MTTVSLQRSLLSVNGGQSFICHWGCTGTFKLNDIVQHLLLNHSEEDLKTWCISKELLLQSLNDSNKKGKLNKGREINKIGDDLLNPDIAGEL